MTVLTQRAPVDGRALDQVFRRARTYNTWLDQPVPEAVLREI